MKKLFIFTIILCFANFVASQEKPGNCPPRIDIGVCEAWCFSDYHCGGADKCCQTVCGGTACIRPISSRIEEKPGLCPSTPTGPWVCSSRCSADSECRGSKKCCKNRCGAMACVKPDKEEEDNAVELSNFIN